MGYGRTHFNCVKIRVETPREKIQVTYLCKNSSSSFENVTVPGVCFKTRTRDMASVSNSMMGSEFVGPGVYTFQATMRKLSDGSSRTLEFTVTVLLPTTPSEGTTSTTVAITSTSSEASTSTKAETEPETTTMTTTAFSSSSTVKTTENSDSSTTSSSESTTTEYFSTLTPTTFSTSSEVASESSTTSTAESTSSSTSSLIPDSQFDFYLQNMTWNETVYYNQNLDIYPTPNISTLSEIYQKTVFECRNDTGQEFLPLKQSLCLNYDLPLVKTLSFTRNIMFEPASNGIISPGYYEIRINMTNLLTDEQATHILILYVIEDTTTAILSSTVVTTMVMVTSTSTSTSATTTTRSEAQSTDGIDSTATSSEKETTSEPFETSTTESSSTISTPTRSSAALTTKTTITTITTVSETKYDFYLNGSTWNKTIDYSADTLFIGPVPNKDPTLRKISYTCRNDSTSEFVSLGTSNCITEKSKTSLASYSTEITWSPVRDYIPGPGTYEYNITVTNALTGETATHLFTLNVVSEATGTTEITTRLTITDTPTTTNRLTTRQTTTTTTTDLVLTSSKSGSDGSVESQTSTTLVSSSDSGSESGSNREESTTTTTTKTTTTTISTTPSEKFEATTEKNVVTTSQSDNSLSSEAPGGSGNADSGFTVSTSASTTKTRATRAKGVLGTSTPITAAEQAAIDAQKKDVMDQLTGIIDGTTSQSSLNTSSTLLNQISTMPTSDLVEVAQSLLSNTLKVPDVGNMSSIDVLTALKDNVAATNSELADEMNKVISQLAAVNMTSAESMNSVLSSLDLALKGSTVYTLGFSSTTSTDGSYSVIFGRVVTSSYTLVSPRCTLSVYGSTVYLTGDTRGSYFQQTEDSVTVS
uniref:Uncharacterized protein n=1 Tax=Caenorhabditis japonica TaxID=281687 RepID=A0A8R1HVU5_CAEJA